MHITPRNSTCLCLGIVILPRPTSKSVVEVSEIIPGVSRDYMVVCSRVGWYFLLPGKIFRQRACLHMWLCVCVCGWVVSQFFSKTLRRLTTSYDLARLILMLPMQWSAGEILPNFNERPASVRQKLAILKNRPRTTRTVSELLWALFDNKNLNKS